MNIVSGEELLRAQRQRFATKLFDRNRAVPNSLWNVLEECLRLTPSAYNLQPWKFIVITDEDLKSKLRTYSFNQEQIEDCSHLVVICNRETTDPEWLERLMVLTAMVKSVDRSTLDPHLNVVTSDLFGIRKNLLSEINIRQCYIALGNLLTSASLLGLDTCPIEGFLIKKYDEILELAGTGWKSCVVCAVGYRHVDDQSATLPKVRFPLEDVIDRRD